MNIEAAAKIIKTLGNTKIEAIEKLGFKKAAAEAREVGALMIGLSAYIKFNMKGKDADLDQAYDSVFDFIYNKGGKLAA